MNNTYIALVLGVIVVVLGALWYTRTSETDNVALTTMGTYAYTCDGGVEFLMTPDSAMNSIKIEPVRGMGYPSASTLVDSPTDTGRRYRSLDFEFHGRGESVTLYAVASQTTYTCTPQPKPNEAPFNFGD